MLDNYRIKMAIFFRFIGVVGLLLLCLGGWLVWHWIHQLSITPPLFTDYPPALVPTKQVPGGNVEHFLRHLLPQSSDPLDSSKLTDRSQKLVQIEVWYTNPLLTAPLSISTEPPVQLVSIYHKWAPLQFQNAPSTLQQYQLVGLLHQNQPPSALTIRLRQGQEVDTYIVTLNPSQRTSNQGTSSTWYYSNVWAKWPLMGAPIPVVCPPHVCDINYAPPALPSFKSWIGCSLLFDEAMTQQMKDVVFQPTSVATLFVRSPSSHKAAMAVFWLPTQMIQEVTCKVALQGHREKRFSFYVGQKQVDGLKLQWETGLSLLKKRP